MDARTIIDAITQFPDKAAAAVETLPPPPGQSKPLTAAKLDGAAASLGRDRAKFWVQQLRSDGHLQAFVFALRARGVAFAEDALADPDAAIQIDKLSDFLPRAKAFRCKVLVNGKIKGSGVARRTEPGADLLARDRHQEARRAGQYGVERGRPARRQDQAAGAGAGPLPVGVR